LWNEVTYNPIVYCCTANFLIRNWHYQRRGRYLKTSKIKLEQIRSTLFLEFIYKRVYLLIFFYKNIKY